MSKTNIKNPAGLNYKGDTFKNDSELGFAKWLDRMMGWGFVTSWSYESVTFQLMPRRELTDGLLVKTIRPCSYTPDFVVTLGENWLATGINWVTSSDKKVYIETKGSRKSRGYNETYLKTKILYDKHEIYTNIVVYKELYGKTFTVTPGEAGHKKFKRSEWWISRILKKKTKNKYFNKCMYFGGNDD